MLFSIFRSLEESEKKTAVENLICESTPHREFFLMVLFSVSMATCGLLINSSAVVIGSMLIAPILSPVLSLSLALAISDHKLIARSFYTILKSSLYALAVAVVIALFLIPREYEMTSSFISHSGVSLVYILIAIISGTAASLAYVKTNLNKTLPGVAISVALIPPLASSGIGMAMFDWGIISQSLILFVANVIGIVLASTAVFSLMDLHSKKKVAEATVKKEEIQLDKENEK